MGRNNLPFLHESQPCVNQQLSIDCTLTLQLIRAVDGKIARTKALVQNFLAAIVRNCTCSRHKIFAAQSDVPFALPPSLKNNPVVDVGFARLCVPGFDRWSW